MNYGLVHTISDDINGNVIRIVDLTLKMIVNWMIDWHNETGAWATVSDGEIPNSGGEKWSNLNATLHRGGRNLPKTSLAKLRKKLEKKALSN